MTSEGLIFVVPLPREKLYFTLKDYAKMYAMQLFQCKIFETLNI